MIPQTIKKKLETLPRMKACEHCGAKDVQWHHALQYSKKSMQEVFAIRALCYTCHMGNSMKPTRKADVISKINAIEEGMKDLKKKYPKRDWKQELQGYRYELSQLKEKEMETLKAKLNGYI